MRRFNLYTRCMTAIRMYTDHFNLSGSNQGGYESLIKYLYCDQIGDSYKIMPQNGPKMAKNSGFLNTLSGIAELFCMRNPFGLSESYPVWQSDLSSISRFDCLCLEVVSKQLFTNHCTVHTDVIPACPRFNFKLSQLTTPLLPLLWEYGAIYIERGMGMTDQVIIAIMLLNGISMALKFED